MSRLSSDVTTTRSARGERIFALAATAVVLGFLAASLVGSLRDLGKPFCGFSVMEGLLVTPFSSREWSGPAAGVKPLDVVVSADGVAVHDLARLRAVVAEKNPGETVRYRLKRFGGGAVELDVPVMALGVTDVWAFLFPVAFTGAAYILIALIVYIFLPGTMLGRLFFAGGALMGLTTALDYDFATTGAWARLWMATGPVAIAAGWHLCFHYPERSPFLEKRPWLVWLGYPVPLGFAISFQAFLFRPELMIYLIGAYSNYVLAALFAEGAVIFHTYRRSDSPLARQRVRILLAPFLITTSVMIFGALAAAVADLWIPIQYVAVVSVVYPAVLAYGLVTNKLFESEGWLRRTVGYVTFTSLVIALYAALLIVLERLLASQLPPDTVRNLPVASAVLVVLLLMPAWRMVQDAIDRIFYRRRADLSRILTELSENLSRTFSVEGIDEVLAEGLEKALSPEYVAVFRDGTDGAFPLRAERGVRPAALDATLARPIVDALGGAGRVVVLGDPALSDDAARLVRRAGLLALVPVRAADKLIAVLLLGRPKSGGAYAAAVFEFLILLSAQAAVSYDNTRLLEAEKDRDRIIQQESLAALAQLVNGAAHELRNPLATAHSLLQSALESIDQLADMGEKPAAVGADVREALQIAQGQHSRIGSIVKTLHELSELSAQGKEMVPVERVLDDALRAIRHKYESRVFQVVYERGADLPRVRGSYAQLSQLFLNLLDNAVQSLPDSDGVLRLRLRADNGVVEFRCEDNGCGIPKKHLHEVFRPFFTTRPTTSGARGLGLYVSHEIVRTHNGEINLESTPDKGTIASVRIPIEPA